MSGKVVLASAERKEAMRIFNLFSLRHSAIVVAVTAVSMAATLTAAPDAQAVRDRFTKITPAQCREAHAAVAAGQPLPDPSLFRWYGSSLKGDTLHVYVSDRAEAIYGGDIRQSAQSWTDASAGKIKFKFHDHLEDGVVDIRIEDNSLGAAATTAGAGTARPIIRLKPTIGPESRVHTIAHEMGHALGLGHGCVGDLMKAGSTPGPVAMSPTATDVAAVMQGNPAFN